MHIRVSPTCVHFLLHLSHAVLLTTVWAVRVAWVQVGVVDAVFHAELLSTLRKAPTFGTAVAGFASWFTLSVAATVATINGDVQFTEFLHIYTNGT